MHSVHTQPSQHAQVRPGACTPGRVVGAVAVSWPWPPAVLQGVVPCRRRPSAVSQTQCLALVGRVASLSRDIISLPPGPLFTIHWSVLQYYSSSSQAPHVIIHYVYCDTIPACLMPFPSPPATIQFLYCNTISLQPSPCWSQYTAVYCDTKPQPNSSPVTIQPTVS